MDINDKKDKGKGKKKRWIIIAGIALVVVVGGFFLINPVRSLIAMTTMKPLETQEIVADVYAVKNQFVNLYLVKSGDTYIAFDAGSSERATQAALDEFGIDANNVVAVFLTHADFDHTAGIPLFSSAEIYMADSNRIFMEGQVGASRSKGFLDMKRDYNTLKDGETITVSDVRIQCIFTPGHTDGSASFIVDDRYLFTGDNLSLDKGKAALFTPVFNMDPDEQERSIRKLALLEGIDYVFTMHNGYTSDFETAFSDWR